MQWEDDEDDEIQASKATRIPEEKRHHQSRPSNAHQHRRKELPVYEDPFTKRLGRRSTSVARERIVERTNGFSSAKAKTTEQPKWTSIDEIPRPGKYWLPLAYIYLNQKMVNSWIGSKVFQFRPFSVRLVIQE